MSRTTYVYDEKLGKMVVKARQDYSQGQVAPMIMPDLPDFVSPVDGRVVHGRAGLRVHNKDLGVTNTADYTNEWKQKEKEREKFFAGGRSEDRARAVAEAVQKHSSRR